MGLEDRTEQASQQHRQDARKKGQVAKSTDVTSGIVLIGGLLALKWAAPTIMGRMAALAESQLGHLSAFQATPANASRLFTTVTLAFLGMVAPILGAVAITGIVGNVAQVGFFFSTESIKPDLNKMNPLTGLARMFSGRSLAELGKSLLKVTVVGWIVYAFLRDQQATVVSIGVVDPAIAGRTAGDLIWRLCMRATSVILLIASVDYIYQRWMFEKSIRMTKQEVKEEFKRSEGDPAVKQAFRQRRRELAKHRMMQDVPTADVVVTNPTHYAVALKYDSATMAAPIVVAKGQRLVAQRIKELAREHRVPMVENKPVARALFAMAEIGDPVPLDLYQAVAEILAFVYKLKRK
ncbi:MAG TPA: flagellar biosynthesis protein FlhB [Armatimonadota bacterium]